MTTHKLKILINIYFNLLFNVTQKALSSDLASHKHTINNPKGQEKIQVRQFH